MKFSIAAPTRLADCAIKSMNTKYTSQTGTKFTIHKSVITYASEGSISACVVEYAIQGRRLALIRRSLQRDAQRGTRSPPRSPSLPSR